MEEWEVNLLDTDDAMLVGDVGEAIALHYLTSHGFFIVNRPIKLLHGELSLISAHYQLKPPKLDRGHWLTNKQKEYLENFPTWDYVAFKKECKPYLVVHEGKQYFRDWRNPYLVEVKTVRGERRLHKKPKSNSVSRAKALGFKPIFAIVRLLENWDVFVEATEL